MVADVKCYYCGHVSGQIEGIRGAPVAATMFVPRPGFAGELPVTGRRLRCERCGGPVFLEDVTPLTLVPSPVGVPQPVRRATAVKKAA
jgi:hypothetical protein